MYSYFYSMIKISKRNPHSTPHCDLQISKLYHFFPQRRIIHKEQPIDSESTNRNNNSELFHHKISHQEETKDALMASLNSQKELTFRISLFDITVDNKDGTINVDACQTIASEQENLAQKAKKKYSSTLTERNLLQKNWIRTLIRRKNNGSQGQIMKGLTGAKHSKILQKVKSIRNSEAPSAQVKKYVQQRQSFMPLGYLRKEQIETNRTVYHHEEKKLKIALKRKKRYEAAQHNAETRRIHIKTEPEDVLLQQQKTSRYETAAKCSRRYGRTFRKQSSPIFNQKIISPWEDQSFN